MRTGNWKDKYMYSWGFRSDLINGWARQMDTMLDLILAFYWEAGGVASKHVYNRCMGGEEWKSEHLNPFHFTT